jgi:hypothetical protein
MTLVPRNGLNRLATRLVCFGESNQRVMWLVRLVVRTCTCWEVLVVQYVSNTLANCSGDVNTKYVHPMEKYGSND